MPGYQHKDAVTMAYDDNKKRMQNEGRILLAHLMNEAVNQMTVQFNEALLRGEVLSIEGTREEMQGFLRVAAQKQLGVGA